MNKSSNTLKDLFTKEEHEEYAHTEFPFNIAILDKALKAKLKEDPTYEVWMPFVYCKHFTRVKDKNQPSIIKPYETYISNKGGLCSIRKGEVRYLSISLANEYPTAAVYCGPKKMMSFRLHRALATCFIPPKPELAVYHPKDLEVNHKNGIKSDFELDNLEWCTTQENVLHAVENSLLVYNTGKAHHNTKPVKGIVLYGPHKGYSFLLNGVAEYQIYGFTQGKISACALSKEKSHKNCAWSYATEEEIKALPVPDKEILKEVLAHQVVNIFKIEVTNLETSVSYIFNGSLRDLNHKGFRAGCVWNVMNGRVKSHKGHYFKRLEH